VALGGTVTVALRGVPGQPWRPVAAQGDSLSQGTAPSAPADATSAGFVAVRPGIATVTSSRSACPPASPGSVSCKALQAFSVTVQVR
jgi:hypothetical protein